MTKKHLYNKMYVNIKKYIIIIHYIAKYKRRHKITTSVDVRKAFNIMQKAVLISRNLLQ